MPLRVAIDANILIAGIVWPRWPYEVLQHAIQRDFTLVLSPLVIQEAVHRVQHDFPALVNRLELYLLAVPYEAAPLPTSQELAAHSTLMRQAKDIPIALSIHAANVDYFVTYDRDFTDLGKTTEQVRQALPGIILPPVFLREVMGWTSEQLEAIRHRNWSELAEGN